MKRNILLLLTLVAIAAKAQQTSVAGFFPLKDSGRIVYNFNEGWRFHLGDAPGAEVADYDDSVGLFRSADFLKFRHHSRGLLDAGTAAVQVDVWFGQPQLAEENAAHGVVVMLPSVYEERLNRIERFKRFKNRRDFHKVWTRAYNTDDLHDAATTPLNNLKKISTTRRPREERE